jgi:hypothetical protein
MATSWGIGLRRAAGVGAMLAATGLLALLPASADAANEYELNDFRESAYGPLEGGKAYTATFETANDVDWYLFYIKAYSQMDFSTTTVDSKCSTISNEMELDVIDKDGHEIDEHPFLYLPIHGVNEGKTYHARLTMKPGRYYLRATGDAGCEGSRYRFRIDPATALTTSRECGEAIVAKDEIAPLLAKVSGEVGESNAALAKANASTGEAKATLLRLNRRWAKFSAKWKVAVKKVKRKRSWSGFIKRQKRQRLIATKRRVNRRLQAAKGPAKRELSVAKEARAEVAQERAGLLTLQAQHTATVTQADAQIAAHC